MKIVSSNLAPRVILLFVACLLLISLPVLHAQTTGKIAGKVTDAASDEPLPGVNILIEGTSLGAATNTNGEYFILNVTPGAYQVNCSFIGYRTINISDVQVFGGRTTDLNVDMQEAALTGEAVTITAERPTIIRDLTSSADFITGEVAEKAPGEGLRDILELTPGIELNEDGNFVIRGGDINEVRMYVDGIEQSENFTHYRQGGERADRSWIMDMNVLGIQEMEVITGGFNAEYGKAQSGIVRIVSKEGGRNFHADLRVEYSPAGQYHFGPYYYTQNSFMWENYGNLAYWQDIYTNPDRAGDKSKFTKFNLETPQEAFELWKSNYTPAAGNIGEAYDYRNEIYKRVQFGIGGPLGLNDKVTFFLAGEWRDQPTLIPTSSRTEPYNHYDLNVTYRIKPTMKLRFKMYYSSKFRYSDTDIRNIAEAQISVVRVVQKNSNKFSVVRDGPPIETYNIGQSLTWTHTVSAQTFYEVSLAHQYERHLAFSTIQHSNKSWQQIPAGEWRGGYRIPNMACNPNNFQNYTHKYLLYGHLTSQISQRHQIKFGTELNYSQQLGFGSEKPSGIISRIAFSYYDKSEPYYGGFYFQDKIEYHDVIANIGFRTEIYNSNTRYYDDPLSPFYPTLDEWGLGAGWEANPHRGKSGTKFKISPRFGISHPISENTVMHFQYGHFYSIPGYNALFQAMNYGGWRWYMNPDLDMRKTVSYEFGIQHNLAGTHRVNVVGYFNDLSDQTAWIKMHSDVGEKGAVAGFRRFVNNTYGESKGVEVSLENTAVGNWYYRGNFTLSRTSVGSFGPKDVWSLDPNDPFNWTNRQSATSNVRGGDRTYKFNMMVQYTVPDHGGPAVGEFHPLGGIMSSFTFRYMSGRPFTFIVPGDPFRDLTNNRRWPGSREADLKIQKFVKIESLGIRPLVFVRVTNLFNNQRLKRQNTEAFTKYNELSPDNYIDELGYRYNYENMSRRFVVGLGLNF